MSDGPYAALIDENIFVVNLRTVFSRFPNMIPWCDFWGEFVSLIAINGDKFNLN